MSEVKKIATRESYGKALVELGAEHSNLVVLDADLAAATKTGMFRKAFPDRHFDCGIAEANMIAVAAGLSTMGLVPFASSFAMFAAGRAFEQVRNSVGEAYSASVDMNETLTDIINLYAGELPADETIEVNIGVDLMNTVLTAVVKGWTEGSGEGWVGARKR